MMFIILNFFINLILKPDRVLVLTTGKNHNTLFRFHAKIMKV